MDILKVKYSRVLGLEKVEVCEEEKQKINELKVKNKAH